MTGEKNYFNSNISNEETEASRDSDIPKAKHSIGYGDKLEIRALICQTIHEPAMCQNLPQVEDTKTKIGSLALEARS